MDAFIDWIEQSLALDTPLQWRLIASVVVILATVLLRWLVMALVSRRTDDTTLLYRWRKIVEYVSLLVGLFFLGRIWLVGSQSLVTYLGLVSAGLAIALQDPISNIFGWLFIVGRRPFEVGDRIEIGDNAGDVVDIRIFQFSVLEVGNWVAADQSTGRILHIPNKKIFTETLANYHKGITFIWNEIPVTITFESNWRKAKTLLEEVVEQHSGVLAETARAHVREAARRYMISYENLTPIVYTHVGTSGVVLTARYLCDPRKRRTSEQAVWEALLDAFHAQPDIELAYPTQRITYHPREQGANAPPAQIDADGEASDGPQS